MGFALEATNARENALQKLRAKNCDWIVLNAPSAIGSETNSVELINPAGAVAESWSGSKADVARSLVGWIERGAIRG
jgi:phosphopantothenoylcysteine decarboxylase/phosphopantothenate--cysteine ligase